MIVKTHPHKQFAFALLLVCSAGAILSCAASAVSSPQDQPGAVPTYAHDEQTRADRVIIDPPEIDPSAEGFKLGNYRGHGEFEAGYRWSPGIGGNEQMYRTQNNLFQGARLLRSFVSLRAPSRTGLFDRLDLSFNNWGDPYNTVRLDIGRTDLYRFTFNYRNLRYYTFVPSFANPLVNQGVLFAQHNLDVVYRTADFELRLFPNRRISPYLGYLRSSASGPGSTTYYPTGNEFLLNTKWKYAGDQYRAGLQFSFPSWSLVLEQGYRYIKNDTGITDGGAPLGNNPVPFMGQDIVLDSLQRSYHERRKLPTSRILAKAFLSDNLRLTGRYIYTMGDLEADLFEFRSGSLVSLADLLRYGSAADSFSGRAKRPNHNGAFLIEYRPFSRLTLTDSFDTYDYNVSGSAILSSMFADTSSLVGPGVPTSDTTVTSALSSRLDYRQVRNEAVLEYDLGHGLAAQAGHRYSFIDVDLENPGEETEEASLSRNTALVGVRYRPSQKLRIGFDYEINRTDDPLVRTTLIDYDRLNINWKIGAWKGFTLNGRVSILQNRNPATDIDWNSHDRNYMIALNYRPNDRISLDLDYSRSNYFSDILIVIPQTLAQARSIFNERTSGIGGRMDIGIIGRNRIEIGYRGIINRGNFPLEYHQPYASLWIPLRGNLAFRPFWQYFGYREELFRFEDYRTHLVTFSIVYGR